VVTSFVARLEERLPWPVYVLQAGLVLNAFGNGAANPFLLIYLHDVRHIPLAAAGLAIAANAGCGLVSSFVAGAVADRTGPRSTVLGGLALATAVFLAYPLVTNAWEAVVAGGLLGTAAGGWLTGQTVLLAAIVPPERRHVAFAQQRVAANLGLGLGGLGGGLIASTSSARTFDVLFLVNALTFAGYGAFVARVRTPPGAPVPQARGYRRVARDRTLLRVLALDFVLVAAAVAPFNSLTPVYARNTVGLREGLIGALFLINSLLIIGGQLPVARLVEGHRRARALALMAFLFAACWLLTLAAGLTTSSGFALLLAAFAVMSAGECIYDSVRGPLVADLAPEGLSGRYLASAGISWQLAFIVGPAGGAALLGLSPVALWIAAAAACAAAGAAALRLDGLLPERARVTAARSR
jgi:MFS family permease